MVTSGIGNGLCWSVWNSRAASAVIWYVENEGKLDFESKLVDDVSVLGTWCMLLVATGDGGSMAAEPLKFECDEEKMCCWSSAVLDAVTIVGGDVVCWLLFAEGWGRVGSTTATACEMEMAYERRIQKKETYIFCIMQIFAFCHLGKHWGQFCGIFREEKWIIFKDGKRTCCRRRRQSSELCLMIRWSSAFTRKRFDDISDGLLVILVSRGKTGLLLLRCCSSSELIICVWGGKNMKILVLRVLISRAVQVVRHDVELHKIKNKGREVEEELLTVAHLQSVDSSLGRLMRNWNRGNHLS